MAERCVSPSTPWVREFMAWMRGSLPEFHKRDSGSDRWTFDGPRWSLQNLFIQPTIKIEFGPVGNHENLVITLAFRATRRDAHVVSASGEQAVLNDLERQPLFEKTTWVVMPGVDPPRRGPFSRRSEAQPLHHSHLHFVEEMRRRMEWFNREYSGGMTTHWRQMFLKSENDSPV